MYGNPSGHGQAGDAMEPSSEAAGEDREGPVPQGAGLRPAEGG